MVFDSAFICAICRLIPSRSEPAGHSVNAFKRSAPACALADNARINSKNLSSCGNSLDKKLMESPFPYRRLSSTQPRPGKEGLLQSFAEKSYFLSAPSLDKTTIYSMIFVIKYLNIDFLNSFKDLYHPANAFPESVDESPKRLGFLRPLNRVGLDQTGVTP